MSLLGMFGRKVAVEIGPEGGTGIRLADLRVGFKVEHKAGPVPSKATIRIFNPAAHSIALLKLPLASIRLLVGYEPLERVLFQGPPVKDGIDLKVEGPDRILEVDASDGGRAYVSTFLNLSFAAPTTVGQILNLILAQTLWARGTILVPEALTFPSGLVLFGRPAEVLSRLAAMVPPFGADWWVADNVLYMVPKGQAAPGVAPLISSTAGNLIGSPTGTKKGVKVKALIDATMRPGRAFVLESLGHSGTYVAKDITFTGDTGYERDFYMEITAKPPGVP